MAKSYNELRSANLHENRRMLEELGVRMPRVGERVILNKPKLLPKRPKQSIPVKIPEADPDEDDGENKPDDLGRSGSRSFRVRLRPKNFQEEEEYIFDPPKPRPPTIRPNPSYGKITGVEVGREWATRMECSYDLIHRPTVAGIHGGPNGAYSVALSGGYEDDIDFGESFTYTGEGGRDLKGTKANPKNLRTAPQSKDQSLDRGNLALARSVETQNPVRVVRGYKLDSQYAPEEGYRYDGLYLVKKYWAAVGKSGYKVWKFAFVRCDSEPAPWVQTSGNLGSPTSPTTPASIPQTGVEACEAPSLDTDNGESYLQLEEAQTGAKHPDDRNRTKKKVRFNSEDSVRIFETESCEEEKSEESGRMTTRSSSAKVVESSVVESGAVESGGGTVDEDLKPAQLCKRSQRIIKPTAKVLANISLEDDKKPPPKLVNASKRSASPVVLITDMSLTSIPNQGGKKKSDRGDDTPKERKEEETPKKSPAVSKSPKTEKSSLMGSDSVSKNKCLPEDKSEKKSISPKERSNKLPEFKKTPESAAREKSRKKSVSPGYSSKSEKPKSSSDDLLRKRSISPDYPSPFEELKSEEMRTKRSISPEYLPEDEVQDEKALKIPRTLSPQPSPADKVERRGRPKKSSISPGPSPADDKSGKRSEGTPRQSSISPQPFSAEYKVEKRSRGRPRKSPLLPQPSPVDEKTKQSPKSLLDTHSKVSPMDKKSKKSPKSSPREERSKRSISPEYPPEDENQEILTDSAAQGKSKKYSVSPEYQRKKSSSGSPPKNSPISVNSPPKETPKRNSSPNYQTKNVDKQSKSSRSLTEEKLLKKTKSPTRNASNKTPESAGVGTKRFRTEETKNSPSSSLKKSSKNSPDSPKRLKSDDPPTSPEKNLSSSKKTTEISQSMKSSKSPKILKTDVKKSEKSKSPKNPAEIARNSVKKSQSPEEKSKQGATKVSKSRKRSSFSDEESAEAKTPMEKKPRVNSPLSEKLTKAKKFVVKENEDDEISDNELDAPFSPDSIDDEAPTECDSDNPSRTTLAVEPETKSFEKEVTETLTPPETETSNSNRSSPTPSPPRCSPSPAGSRDGSTDVSQAPVLVKANEKPWDILDNDDFPSDEEILSMMQISVGACTSDGPRITVKMVNGKWIEMEDNDTATKQNNAITLR